MQIARPDRPPVGVHHFPGKGRGVVALKDIPQGATIERVPVLVVPESDRLSTDGTVIFTYVFMWEHGSVEQDLYDGWGRAAIALGVSSLLNHSYEPNAEFIRHIDQLELEIRARRNICSGEEVTIDYQMKLWFDPV